MRPEIEYVYNKLKKLRFDFKASDFRDFRNYYRYDPELMRYVRKDDNDLFIAKDTFKPLEEELEYADKCHNLEEQLGCPLEVFLKALDKGFYCPKNFGGREFILSSNDYQTQTFKNINDEWTISFIDNNVAVAGIHLKDYKKTWWIKEDKSE